MVEHTGALTAISHSERSFWSDLYRFEQIQIGATALSGLYAAPELHAQVQSALGSEVTLYVKGGFVVGIRQPDGPLFHTPASGYLLAATLWFLLGVLGWVAIVPGLICWALAVPPIRLYWASKGMQRMANEQSI